MDQRQTLVDLGSKLAAAINETLIEHLGAEHGFVLLIAERPAGNGEGPGHLFSNIEPSDMLRMLADASKFSDAEAPRSTH